MSQMVNFFPSQFFPWIKHVKSLELIPSVVFAIGSCFSEPTTCNQRRTKCMKQATTKKNITQTDSRNIRGGQIRGWWTGPGRPQNATKVHESRILFMTKTPHNNLQSEENAPGGYVTIQVHYKIKGFTRENSDHTRCKLVIQLMNKKAGVNTYSSQTHAHHVTCTAQCSHSDAQMCGLQWHWVTIIIDAETVLMGNEPKHTRSRTFFSSWVNHFISTPSSMSFISRRQKLKNKHIQINKNSYSKGLETQEQTQSSVMPMASTHQAVLTKH